jgi:hypothetical protein
MTCNFEAQFVTVELTLSTISFILSIYGACRVLLLLSRSKLPPAKREIIAWVAFTDLVFPSFHY